MSDSRSETKAVPPASSSNRLFVVGGAALLVLGLAAIAVVASNRGDGEATLAAAEATADVSVEGDALDPLPGGVQLSDPSNDPMIGELGPTVTGTDINGEELVIGPNGSPKAIYFLAHWCPHCQEEVPTLQSLIDESGIPDGVEVYAVSTAVDASRGNFPPAQWLKDEGFTPPVLKDDDSNSAANAFGLSGYPYAVYLDAEHRVLFRSSGGVPSDVTAIIWEELAAS